MTQSDTQLRSVSSIRQERREAAFSNYGGFYWGADFLGFAVAIFFCVVLLALVGAIVGAAGYQMGAHIPKPGAISGTTETLGLGGLIGSLVAIFISYLIGGYAAGRMGRFDGVRNGIGVVIWTIIVFVILGILGGILGSKFDVAAQLHLKLDTHTMTVAGIISIIATLIVLIVAAAIGGWLGARFHRGIDEEAGLRQ